MRELSSGCLNLTLMNAFKRYSARLHWLFPVAAVLVLIASTPSRSDEISQPQAVTPALRQRIDALVNGEMKRQHLAGMSLAIAQDGNILYARGYGYRNIVKHLAATPNTIYNIGSITKQFTAAAVMLLQEDGKLHVDDPVARYISGLPWGARVTVRELLNHTSGVPDYLSIVDNNSLTQAKIMAALRKTRLRFPPGSVYQYSNINYILAGVVVANASGFPFDDFLRRRIFQPLQLHSTSIGTTPLDMPRGATGYTVIHGQTKPVDPKSDSTIILDYPDGGVNTTVLDLVKWDTALDNGRVVRPETFRLMTTPSHHRSDWPYGYGFGLGLDRVHGHREVVHEGEWTGFAGENATFPNDGFAIVMLSNTDHFQEDALKRRIFRLFYP